MYARGFVGSLKRSQTLTLILFMTKSSTKAYGVADGHIRYPNSSIKMRVNIVGIIIIIAVVLSVVIDMSVAVAVVAPPVQGR